MKGSCFAAAYVCLRFSNAEEPASGEVNYGKGAVERSLGGEQQHEKCPKVGDADSVAHFRAARVHAA